MILFYDLSPRMSAPGAAGFSRYLPGGATIMQVGLSSLTEPACID